MLNGSFAFTFASASRAMFCFLEIFSQFDTMTVMCFLLGWIAFLFIASAVGIYLIGVKFENWIKTFFQALGSKTERMNKDTVEREPPDKGKASRFPWIQFLTVTSLLFSS